MLSLPAKWLSPVRAKHVPARSCLRMAYTLTRNSDSVSERETGASLGTRPGHAILTGEVERVSQLIKV